MSNRNIIVIGASTGGFDAIKKICEDIPADLYASIFIVWHMSADVRGILPHVLNKSGKLYAVHAIDGEVIKPGRIYIAPPDRHLMLERGVVRVTHGPKENRFRPAIDPLFRSAALAYGSQVIGVVLSGGMDDGTAGLWAIKQQGGVAIVQDPMDAMVSSMPVNAINAVQVEFVVPAKEIGGLIGQLVNEQIVVHKKSDAGIDQRMQMEVNIAMKKEKVDHQIFKYGNLSPYTCPECHGVLTALSEGDRIRFRCHTGHAFSAESLLAGITENIEDAMWNTIRSLQESTLLLNHMGDHFAEANQGKIAAMYFKKAKEAMQRADMIKKAVFDHEHLSADEILEQANGEDNWSSDTDIS